jgi:hypothetical protein
VCARCALPIWFMLHALICCQLKFIKGWRDDFLSTFDAFVCFCYCLYRNINKRGKGDKHLNTSSRFIRIVMFCKHTWRSTTAFQSEGWLWSPTIGSHETLEALTYSSSEVALSSVAAIDMAQIPRHSYTTTAPRRDVRAVELVLMKESKSCRCGQ